jgi:hypothetical protein
VLQIDLRDSYGSDTARFWFPVAASVSAERFCVAYSIAESSRQLN